MLRCGVKENMNLEAPNRMDRRPRTTALLASLTDDLREIRRTAKKRLSLITRRGSVGVEATPPTQYQGEDDDTILLLDGSSNKSLRDCGVDDLYLEQLRRRSLRNSSNNKTPTVHTRNLKHGKGSKRNLCARRSSCGASSTKPKVAILNISYDYLTDEKLKPQQRDPNSSLCSLTLEESFSTFHNDSLSTFNDSLRANDESLLINNDSFRMNEDCFDWASTGEHSHDHEKECFFVVNNESWMTAELANSDSWTTAGKSVKTTAEKSVKTTAEKSAVANDDSKTAEGESAVANDGSRKKAKRQSIAQISSLSLETLNRDFPIEDKANDTENTDNFNDNDAEEWQTKFQLIGDEYQKLWEHCQGLVGEINKKNQLLKNEDDRSLTRKEMKRQLYWYALENVLLRKRLAIQEQEQAILRTRLHRQRDVDGERSNANI